MPNLGASLGWVIYAIISLPLACSKDRRDDGSARAPVASAPAPPASPAVSMTPAPVNTIDVATAKAVEKSCTGICERSHTLKCAHADDCMKSCIGMAIGTPCSEPFRVLYACLSSEPAAHFECGEDGIAAIREGYCEKEQERTVTCMEAKAQP